MITDWDDDVQRALLAPFESHEWQPVEDSEGRFQPVVSVEDLAARLDLVVGAANWNYEVRPGPPGWLVGRLSVLGVVREWAGLDVNAAFTGCANLLGVGRYLACLGDGVVPAGQSIDDVHFSPEDIADALKQAGYRAVDATKKVAPATSEVAAPKAFTKPVVQTPVAMPAKPAKNENAAPPEDTGEDAGRVCSWPDCGRPLTKGQFNVSMGAFHRPLCPAHQKEEGKSGGRSVNRPV